MKNFTAYNTSTGKILRTGQCNDDDFSSQAGSGEGVIEQLSETDGSKEIYLGTIVGITLSSGQPVNVGVTGHRFTTGGIVHFSGLVGTVELNGNYYTITKIGADNITLDDTDSDNFTAWDSGGVATGIVTAPPGDPPFAIELLYPIQRAKIISVGSTYFTCDFIDSNDVVIEEDIAVYPRKHLGSNALNGSVWPNYSAGDILLAVQVGSTWICTDVFDDV